MVVKVCARCKFCWKGPEENNADIREQCPECKSTTRISNLDIKENGSFRNSWAGKIKDQKLPSKKKVRGEFFDGYEWSVDLKKYVKKSRDIDKRNNSYHEKVIDPDTEEVIHECTESLSAHTGHGYDKFNNDSKK